MKRIVILMFTAVAGTVMASPTVFPYDTSMTTRIATNAAVSVSDSLVTLPGSATSAGDTVAELEMNGVTFTAVDSEDWADFVKDLSGVAMLTIKDSGTATNWYGFSNSSWVELTGPAIDLATSYDVRISFDKTTGDKIRYSVKVHGAQDYVDLTSGGNAWVQQGKAASQLIAVDLKGTGSIAAADLASGARAAYANVTGVDQTYSFDYSNVVIGVAVGEGAYGSNAKLKVTLTDGYGNSKFVEKAVVQKATNDVDFTDANLVPGRVYDCKIEVVAEDAPTTVVRNEAGGVAMAANISWYGFASGAFVNATTSNVVIADNAFQAEDEDQPAVVSPVSPACSNSTSVVEIDVDYTYFAVTSEFANAQSALCLTEDGWMCFAAGGWVAITNESVATAAGSYLTRAEFDYTVNPGKVRFSVKQGGEWFVMKNGLNEWFTLSGSERLLAGTSFCGGGKVNAISASYNSIEGVQPTVDGSTITLNGSTDMDLSKVDAGTYTVQSASGKNYNMKWSDKDSKYAKVEGGKLKVVSGTPANGLASYDSFALGLDAENAASKPVLDSAQNAEASKLTFKVPNVVPNTDVAEVTMKVVELDSPSAESGTEAAFENGQAVIALPAGVKYYKVKISIKTK